MGVKVGGRKKKEKEEEGVRGKQSRLEETQIHLEIQYFLKFFRE